jgi:hypothetical protein
LLKDYKFDNPIYSTQMIKHYTYTIIILWITLAGFSLKADVVKTVGSTGADFTTLTAAFTAINSDLTGTTYSGAIQLQIIDNITNNIAAILYSKGGVSSIAKGTSPAWVDYSVAPTVTISAPNQPGGVQATATVTTDGVFTMSNQGSGYTSVPTVTLSGGTGGDPANYATATIANNNWTSVKIYPTVTGKTISYTTGSYFPIECRGGDYLTIDGRLYNSNGTVSGSNPDLTIASVNMVMNFTQDASHNTLTYCNLKGDAPNQYIGLGTAATGNDYNTISYNNITTNAGVRTNVVISLAANAGVGNNYTTISNNNIYDCVKTNAIYFAQYNTNCTISGNSFYETASITQSDDETVIKIFNGTNYNLVIENNYIGGSAPQCSGTWTTNADGATAYSFAAIYLRGDADISKKPIVRGNVIKGFDWNSFNTVGMNWKAIDATGNTGYVDVTGNTVGEIVKRSTTNAVAIDYSGNGLISGNFIYAITATADGGIFGVILNGDGDVSIVNNVISLGGSGTYSTIYGIVDPGTGSGTKNFYHNSVNIWGTTAASEQAWSMAFRNIGTTDTRNIRNNLFINSRTKGALSTGTHWAIYMPASNTNLTSNYNDYYVSPTGVLAYMNGSNQTSMANLRTATGGDANSVNVDPLFYNANGSLASDYKSGYNLLIAGDNTGVTTDIEGTTRSNRIIGAFEQIAVYVTDPQNATVKIAGSLSDVIINAAGVLTMNTTCSVRNLEVKSGGKITFHPSTPYTLNVSGNVVFKSDATTSFSAYLGAGGMSVSGTVSYDKTMDGTKWYFMSFPCDINMTTTPIKKADGTALAVGTDLFIKYYDGSSRALLTAGSNWKNMAAGSTLEKYKGYIFGLPDGQGPYDVRFPLTNALVLSETANPIDVVAYGNGTGVSEIHKGWNLVGYPYISKYTATGANMSFMTFFVDGSYYATLTRDEAGLLSPFTAYFIQADLALETSKLTFADGSRQQVHPDLPPDLSDRLRIKITSPTGSDNTNLIIDEAQSADYQIGQDMVKWLTTGTSKPQCYSILNGNNFAYNALPIKNVQNLPLGLYTNVAGSCTINVDASQAPGITKLLLTDHLSGITTDLLTADYNFSAAVGTVNDRFTLKAEKVLTQNQLTILNEEELVAFICNGKLLIHNITDKTVIRLFDPLGRVIINKTSDNQLIEVELSAKGMYTLQLNDGKKQSVKKLIYH